VQAMLVHVFTASGAFAGMLALERAFARDFATMFAWLALAFVIDGVDGTLARRLRVRERLPHMDGDILDGVVDYLNYVIVPLAAIWMSGLLTPVVGAVAVGVIALCSSLYFADRRMKTHDKWFRGFPALWNVVALYLLVFAPPPAVTLITLALACAAMFVPVAFVHPVRVERLRALTVAVMACWFAAAAVIVWNDFSGPPLAAYTLALAAVYFLALPLWRGSIWAKGGDGTQG